MHPPRLGIILLAPLLLVLAGVSPASAQQRQRRVFTNEDFPNAAPPPAPPAPAATPAPSAEATPGAEGAPPASEEAAETGDELPSGLSLAQTLQGTLIRFYAEFGVRLFEETDPARQQRLRTVLDLANQLLTNNQLYIADLKAQQSAATEAEAQAQAGAP